MDAKTKKYLYIGLILLVVLLAVVVIIKYIKSRQSQDSNTTPSGATTGLTGNITTSVTSIIGGNYIPEKFPLDLYMYGDNVSKFQRYLNLKGAGLTADGKFGPKTQSKALSITGSKTVTQDQFDSYMSELDGGSLANLSSTQSTLPSPTSDMTAYIAKLQNDLVVQSYYWGRDEESGNGIYASLAALTGTVLKSVAQAYKAAYGTELIKAVDNANFKLTTDIDSTIISNLKSVGYNV